MDEQKSSGLYLLVLGFYCKVSAIHIIWKYSFFKHCDILSSLRTHPIEPALDCVV